MERNEKNLILYSSSYGENCVIGGNLMGHFKVVLELNSARMRKSPVVIVHELPSKIRESDLSLERAYM